MTEKIIQVDTDKLKILFNKFEDRDNIYRLLNIHDSMASSLDKQELFTLSEKIIEAKKVTKIVNETLLEIKRMLITGGCVLD